MCGSLVYSVSEILKTPVPMKLDHMITDMKENEGPRARAVLKAMRWYMDS